MRSHTLLVVLVYGKYGVLLRRGRGGNRRGLENSDNLGGGGVNIKKKTKQATPDALGRKDEPMGDLFLFLCLASQQAAGGGQPGWKGGGDRQENDAGFLHRLGGRCSPRRFAHFAFRLSLLVARRVVYFFCATWRSLPFRRLREARRRNATATKRKRIASFLSGRASCPRGGTVREEEEEEEGWW